MLSTNRLGSMQEDNKNDESYLITRFGRLMQQRKHRNAASTLCTGAPFIAVRTHALYPSSSGCLVWPML